MWTIVGIGCQSTTVESRTGAQSLGHRSHSTHYHGATHTVTGGANLTTGIHGGLLIQKADKSPGIGEVGFSIKIAGHGQDNVAGFRLTKAGTFTNNW